MGFRPTFFSLIPVTHKPGRVALTQPVKWLLSLLMIAVTCQVESGQAQSILPATGINGTGTLVTPTSLNPNQLDISGGQLSGNRANLFHSLQRFGLNPNEVANFISQPQIQNILTRVVGGEPSYVYGLIKVTGGNSNLYLMNPAGILFGRTATVNVSASFTATTANGIGFGATSKDLRWFSATGANEYAALNGTPTTFAFTMLQPAAIVNLATMVVGTSDTVPGTSSLTLVGGTVVTAGDLTAISGRQQIRLAAVPGQRLVQLESNPQGGLQWNILPATAASSQPQPWTLPALDLPRLLTGGTIGQATRLQVNADGTLELRVEPDGTVEFVNPGRPEPIPGFPDNYSTGSRLIVETGVVTLIQPSNKTIASNVTAQIEPFDRTERIDDTLTNYLLFPAFVNKCGLSCFPSNTPPAPNTSRIGAISLPFGTGSFSLGEAATKSSSVQELYDEFKCVVSCAAPAIILPTSGLDPRDFERLTLIRNGPFQSFPTAITSAPGNSTPSNPPAEQNLQPRIDSQINNVLSCNSSQEDGQSGACSQSNQRMNRVASLKVESRNRDRILQVIDGGGSDLQQR